MIIIKILWLGFFFVKATISARNIADKGIENIKEINKIENKIKHKFSPLSKTMLMDDLKNERNKFFIYISDYLMYLTLIGLIIYSFIY